LRPLGERSVARNWMRWKHPELDPIIDQIQKLDFDDPKVLELGRDFVKLCAREQPTIPIMSYNVFSVCDETYWTGFPDAEHPYTNPVANWANTKYMFPKIKPKA
jgi:peptide/nickel transport system substrate-binding protein